MAAAPRRLACVRPRPCTSPSWAVRRPAGRKGGPHRGDDQRRHTHGRRRPAGGAGAAHQVPAAGREGGSGPAARQALGGPPAPRARARPGTPRQRRAGAPAPRGRGAAAWAVASVWARMQGAPSRVWRNLPRSMARRFLLHTAGGQSPAGRTGGSRYRQGGKAGRV